MNEPYSLSTARLTRTMKVGQIFWIYQHILLEFATRYEVESQGTRAQMALTEFIMHEQFGGGPKVN